MGSNMYIPAAGAVSRLRQLEIVANNLANAESVGFKADRAVFHAALESAVTVGDDLGFAAGTPGSAHVRLDQVKANHTAGSIRTTGEPFDAAIDGAGFFVVETAEGERYTRAGAFTIGPSGDLVTSEGNLVLGKGGPIDVSRHGTRIQANGEIADDKKRIAGTLRVVEFDDPGVLSKQGNGLFEAPVGSVPTEVASPSLIAGSLENSNVQPVVELAVLMMLQRAFDANMQAMQSEDGATGRLIEEISR